MSQNKKAPIIALMNRKGGVGKSAMNQNISALLASLGYRIGIVDTDSQGHAAVMLGMFTNNPEIDNGLHSALIGGAPLDKVVMEVPFETYGQQVQHGGLCLLPSSDRTYRIPFEIDQSKIFGLLDLIEQMIATYNLDAVFIDTNPTLNLFDAWVFMAADAYIYVTECELLSFDGIQSLDVQVNSIKRDRQRFLNRDTSLLGIIPNKFRASTYIHKRNIAHLSEAFGAKVWTPVTLRTEWVEATELHSPVYLHAPKKQATRDLQQIVTKVQEALGWAPIATN